MECGSVYKILHSRDAHKPSREEFEVAVSNAVHNVKANEICVEHGYRGSPQKERTQQRNREHRGVHDMFREGMYGTSYWFRNETRVVVRVVS